MLRRRGKRSMMMTIKYMMMMMITVFVLGIRIIMLHPGVEKSESSFTGFERLWQAILEKMI